MALITVDEPSEANARSYCRNLEEGHIVYFPRTPFQMPTEDLEFLLAQRQSDAAYHKNIAYRPAEDRVTGLRRGSEPGRLLAIMRGYSRQVARFVNECLTPYARAGHLDYTSFRPQEEQSRELRLRARNDLLHVDSFPSRPTYGDRILRIFTNINPSESRRWVTTDTFEVLASQFVGVELPSPTSDRHSLKQRIRSTVRQSARKLGLPVTVRSPYDEFMLRFHHFLKQNQEFQRSCPKQTWEFAPHSSWIVFTDMVPHAVLSGRYALEQTYIVSRTSLVLPEKAPIAILEKLAGAPLD